MGLADHKLKAIAGLSHPGVTAPPADQEQKPHTHHCGPLPRGSPETYHSLQGPQAYRYPGPGTASPSLLQTGDSASCPAQWRRPCKNASLHGPETSAASTSGPRAVTYARATMELPSLCAIGGQRARSILCQWVEVRLTCRADDILHFVFEKMFVLDPTERSTAGGLPGLF